MPVTFSYLWTFHQRCLSLATGALATVACIAAPSVAGIVTFGSGSGNTFNMEFVTIGDPGNAADTTGSPNPAGRVTYTYGIGKFEVSRDMINKYNANFGTANNLEITLDSMTGITGGTGANKPATGITWNEAARFVNWLNTSTGYQAAYKFAVGSGITDNIQLWTSGEAGYNASNRYRNSLAKYVLPDYNEWYKAAYYDPNKTTGSDKYWDFTTGSNTTPTAVASGTGFDTNGNKVNQAVFSNRPAPADVNIAADLSPYGVMGLGGNVVEWDESSSDLTNSSGASERGIRGSSWLGVGSAMRSSTSRDPVPTDYEDLALGFRVVSLSPVPEPSMMVIGTLFGLGGLAAKRRMKK